MWKRLKLYAVSIVIAALAAAVAYLSLVSPPPAAVRLVADPPAIVREIQQLQELVTVLQVTREDGDRVLTVTEPGIVGKIGLSSAGLGVCLNFLIAARSSDGVPIHILLREALEAGSLDSACLRLRAAGTGRAGNILLGSDNSGAVNFWQGR